MLVDDNEYLLRVARRCSSKQSGVVAEDIAQDVWLRFLQMPPDSVRSWQGWSRIASRCLQIRRSEQAQQRTEREARVARTEGTASTIREIEQADEWRFVHRILNSMGEQHRTILKMHFFDGISVPALATRLGCAPNTVRSRLQGALEALCHRLARPSRSISVMKPHSERAPGSEATPYGDHDPEVVALLAEVLRNPDSQLATSPPHDLSFYGSLQILSSTDPLLTKPERFLLEKHRDEVVLILRKACLQSIVDAPVHETGNPIMFDRRLPWDPFGRRWLTFGLTKQQLAFSVLQVDGSPWAKHILGITFSMEGSYSTSKALFYDLRGQAVGTDCRASVESALANCEFREGRYEVALSHAFRALELDPMNSGAVMNTLTNALLIGDKGAATVAGQAIDVIPQHTIEEAPIARLQRWSNPRPEGRRRWNNIVEILPNRAREFAAAIC